MIIKHPLFTSLWTKTTA